MTFLAFVTVALAAFGIGLCLHLLIAERKPSRVVLTPELWLAMRRMLLKECPERVNGGELNCDDIIFVLSPDTPRDRV